jgi:sigma-B regulation protein RsbU (phosphoserine phosphatase)
MFRNIKIGTKILFVILIVSIASLLIISAISYTQMLNLTKYSQDANIRLGITASEKSKSALITQAEDYLKNIAQKQAEGTNAIFAQVSIDLTALSSYIEAIYANPGNFGGKAIPFVPDAPDEIPCAKYMFVRGVAQSAAIQRELRWISNAEYAFSGMYENNTLMRNIYLGTASGISYRYSRSNSHDPSYDPREQGWYKSAMEQAGKSVWIDTYVDPFGKIGVTCARAFKNAAGSYVGVIATDITVSKMVESILDLKIGTNGYAFLIDGKGDYIAHPRYGEPDFNPKPMEDATDTWRQALIDMLDDKDVGAIVVLDREERYLTSRFLSETGWVLGVCIPIQEVIAPAEAAKDEIDGFTDNAQTYIRKTLASVLMHFIIIFAVLAILVVAFSYIFSANITKPIEELTFHVTQISQGDLDSAIAVQGNDEIADLGTAFNKMTADIKTYIQNIKQITSEQERINSELNIATEIQKDMLPRIFPAFTGHDNFSLFAKMEPAKEVGGDFYDFFFLNEAKTKAAFIIADVSGKGVPAALFMVIAKTLLKQHLLLSQDPVKALSNVNKLLCEDNPRCMFVTVFVITVDLITGEALYANGGHNPPLLCHANEDFQFMKLKKGIPLGVLADAVYLLSNLQLNPGDKFYLYTDGINEAMNDKMEQFGNERFIKMANNGLELTPEAFDNKIREAIAEFSAGMEQFDDITSLCFHFIKRFGT